MPMRIVARKGGAIIEATEEMPVLTAETVRGIRERTRR